MATCNIYMRKLFVYRNNNSLTIITIFNIPIAVVKKSTPITHLRGIPGPRADTLGPACAVGADLPLILY
jgi:hypothetical protein